MESGKKTKGNADQNECAAPVGLLHRKQAGVNTTTLQNVQQVSKQGSKRKTQKEKQNKKQEQVPKTTWVPKDMQKLEVVQEGKFPLKQIDI